VRLAVFALIASIASAQSPDANAIVRKSLERDFFDFNSVKNYTYVEREEERHSTARER